MPSTGHPGIVHLKPSRRYPKGGWEVRFRDAENNTRRRTFPIRQAAIDFQAAVRTDKNRGDYLDPRKGQTRFADLAETWYEGTAHLRPTTRAAYRSMLNTYILPGLGHFAVGRITPSVFRAFLGSLPAELSATRKRHIYRTCVPIFTLAIDDGLTRTSPTRAASVRSAVPHAVRKDMDFLTAEQVSALADAIEPRYRTLVFTAAYTGLRAGELVALRVGALDLEKGIVKVRESASDVNGRLYFGSPKNGKVREVGLPTSLVAMLRTDLGDRRANPRAFVFGSDDKPLRHSNFYARQFKPAVRRSLPPELHGLRFHDLRHTCAALCIANGEHPKAVQERLGHSSIAVTMDRYGKLYKDAERELVARLDETMLEAMGAGPAPDASVTPIR